MKNFIVLILFFFIFTVPIFSENIKTNLSQSELSEINSDLEYSLKKSLTKRFFIPGDKKKILSENLILKENVFTYTLKTVRVSDYYTNTNDTISFYATVIAHGSIPNVTKNSENQYEVTVTGTAKISEEKFWYYGPTNKDIYKNSYNLNYTYILNKDDEKRTDDESSLYYVGTVRKFIRDDLKNLSLDEMGYLRNEFFARHGYIFSSDKMKNYFSEKTWYKPVTNHIVLNEIEAENVEFIRSIEQELAFENNSADVKNINDIYDIAQRRLLTEDDISSLSPYQMPYLRNTFYAKKGLIFYLLQYKDYFNSQKWYKGTCRNVDDLLSDMDKENIQFILQHETK